MDEGRKDAACARARSGVWSALHVTRLPRETYLNDVDRPFVLVVHDLVLSLHDL